MGKVMVLSCLLFLGALAGLWSAFGEGASDGAELMVAHQAVARSALGREEGLCCVVEGGALCDASPLLPSCPGPYPYECECYSHVVGTNCEVMAAPPLKHDVCQVPVVDMEPPPTCAVNAGYCYTVREGVCQNDAGPWSWAGFCSTCGCFVQNPQPKHRGSRNICATGSTNC